MKVFLISLSFLFVTHLSAQPDSDIETVKGILHRQSADWNRGDIEAFMEGYWKSEDLQFVGSNGVTYGWQNTLENYKRRYPDRAAMGSLTFDILRVQKLSDNVILLTGKFTLRRENDQPAGYFTLLWRKIDGKWVIISDHTS